MVKPPFAAPSEVASERDVLLATKLNVPGVRPDLVPPGASWARPSGFAAT